jgi:hypothetical protein
MRAASLVSLVLLALPSCGGGAAPAGTPETHHARLGAATAAVVGASEIPVSLVVDVARAQHLAPRAALDTLITDALAAEGAHATGEDRDPNNAWILESIVARSAAEQVRVTAHTGPPTDAEVAELTERYWRDVDSPERVKVIHAIVLRPKNATATQAEAGRALATQLATDLAGAKSDDDFEARANAFPHGALETKVEHLPAFVTDGRTAEGDPGSMDPSFVRGAFTLKKPGDTSGVVESSFGWHVIRLVERQPPKFVPPEERRARFANEVYAVRGHEALGAILAAHRARSPVDIQPDSDALMALVQRGTPP